MSWELQQGDCLKILPSLPADAFALTFFSPPYEDCRTYGIAFSKQGQDYVDWMVQVFKECLRVTTGLVACVIEGKTRRFRYSCTPILLMADLHRAGIHIRKPPIFKRVGIPGSGGPDWLRNDYEFVICATRGGKLPWSDNTACGHPPKWAPGGEMSYRNSAGTRRNQWGSNTSARTENESGERRANGVRARRGRPSHTIITDGKKTRKHSMTVPRDDGMEQQSYIPPVLANPGNVISCIVGGGVMGGDEYCSQNEAPFPEKLAEFFIRSFCPAGGTVLDPTCGSGTTLAVAHRWGRNAFGIDVRDSQIQLTRRRLEAETPMMFS